jgi:hypothetical protein
MKANVNMIRKKSYRRKVQNEKKRTKDKCLVEVAQKKCKCDQCKNSRELIEMVRKQRIATLVNSIVRDCYIKDLNLTNPDIKTKSPQRENN